jgi:hypothetical protein
MRFVHGGEQFRRYRGFMNFAWVTQNSVIVVYTVWVGDYRRDSVK